MSKKDETEETVESQPQEEQKASIGSFKAGDYMLHVLIEQGKKFVSNVDGER